MFGSKLAQRTLDLTSTPTTPPSRRSTSRYRASRVSGGDFGHDRTVLLSFARSARKSNADGDRIDDLLEVGSATTDGCCRSHERRQPSTSRWPSRRARRPTSAEVSYGSAPCSRGPSSIPTCPRPRLLDHAAGLGDLYDKPRLAAATHTVIDLVDQGWAVQVDRLGPLLSPPDSHLDRETEKARIRRQSKTGTGNQAAGNTTQI